MTRHATFLEAKEKFKKQTKKVQIQRGGQLKAFYILTEGLKFWKRLNLKLREWTCDHNAHVTGHVYGEPCWECAAVLYTALNAGLHWQCYIRHCVLAGSALYHQALKSTPGWVFDVEICLKWRPQWELIV